MCVLCAVPESNLSFTIMMQLEPNAICMFRLSTKYDHLLSEMLNLPSLNLNLRDKSILDDKISVGKVADFSRFRPPIP